MFLGIHDLLFYFFGALRFFVFVFLLILGLLICSLLFSSTKTFILKIKNCAILLMDMDNSHP
ncbi:hypothetical protein AE370_03470 [Salmonella enterica subsp. enterica serovar Newport]|nr:hypothetical protein [Salmonella enterica subsp. enterica serovar Newport]